MASATRASGLDPSVTEKILDINQGNALKSVRAVQNGLNRWWTGSVQDASNCIRKRQQEYVMTARKILPTSRFGSATIVAVFLSVVFLSVLAFYDRGDETPAIARGQVAQSPAALAPVVRQPHTPENSMPVTVMGTSPAASPDVTHGHKGGSSTQTGSRTPVLAFLGDIKRVVPVYPTAKTRTRRSSQEAATAILRRETEVAIGARAQLDALVPTESAAGALPTPVVMGGGQTVATATATLANSTTESDLALSGQPNAQLLVPHEDHSVLSDPSMLAASAASDQSKGETVASLSNPPRGLLSPEQSESAQLDRLPTQQGAAVLPVKTSAAVPLTAAELSAVNQATSPSSDSPGALVVPSGS